MKIFITFILLSLATVTDTFGQVEKLIPAKWKIVQKVEGDFNSDGITDFFVIVDLMDTKKTWQCSKRDILIFHGGQNGVFLADSNKLIFLDRNKLVEADMIYLSAKDNKVTMGIVDLNLGGGYNGGIGYTFRFQNRKWFAIGCSMSGERATTEQKNQQVMERESFSYNFVTGRYERITQLDSKTTNRTTEKSVVRLHSFGQYNGDCDELMK